MEMYMETEKEAIWMQNWILKTFCIITFHHRCHRFIYPVMGRYQCQFVDFNSLFDDTGVEHTPPDANLKNKSLKACLTPVLANFCLVRALEKRQKIRFGDFEIENEVIWMNH